MNIKRNIELDLINYVNIETGELLISEFNNKTIEVKEDTNLFSINKENYAVISTDAILRLQEILNPLQLGYLLKLLPLTKTELNVVYNHSVPHTNKSLMKYLNVSNKTFHEVIKKLTIAGVLYQLKGNINGAIRVIYIVNPFISSRRKTFDKQLLNIFKEF
jgi:hypothetical protein